MRFLNYYTYPFLINPTKIGILGNNLHIFPWHHQNQKNSPKSHRPLILGYLKIDA